MKVLNTGTTPRNPCASYPRIIMYSIADRAKGFLTRQVEALPQISEAVSILMGSEPLVEM